jgi:N-acetylmuramoyl-L-alanine amidase
MSVRKWTHIIIHHTGAEEKDADQVRRYHLSLGWRDVGYHYVVERDGRVVQGRGLDLVGAHCKASSMNYKGIGIAVIGNLQNHSILPAQEKAVVQLAGDLMGRFAIPLSNVMGHNEVPGAATACPGRHFSMDSLRSAVKSGGGGVGSSGGSGGGSGGSGGGSGGGGASGGGVGSAGAGAGNGVGGGAEPPEAGKGGKSDGSSGGSGAGADGGVGAGGERIYRVQVGAYKIRKNAENMAARLKEAGFPVIIKEGTTNSSA